MQAVRKGYDRAACDKFSLKSVLTSSSCDRSSQRRWNSFSSSMAINLLTRMSSSDFHSHPDISSRFKGGERTLQSKAKARRKTTRKVAKPLLLAGREAFIICD